MYLSIDAMIAAIPARHCAATRTCRNSYQSFTMHVKNKMKRRVSSSVTLLRLILPAIVVVGGSIDNFDTSARPDNDEAAIINDNNKSNRNNLLRRRHEAVHVSKDAPDWVIANADDDDEEEDYIDLTLPISVVIRNRTLKKDKDADKNDKDKGGADDQQSVQDAYNEILAKYKALGVAKADAGQSSAAAAPAAPAAPAAQASTVTISANPALQQQQQQQQPPPQQQQPPPQQQQPPPQQQQPPPQQQQQPPPQQKDQGKKQQPAPKNQQQPESTGAQTSSNTGGGTVVGTVVSHTNGVLRVHGGTLDLRGVEGTPSTTPRKRTCAQVKPLLGCDRGGAENQLMKFWNRNFGTCKTCDRGLFKVMPTKMAYYCPEQGRPACGGKCHSASADGKIRDKEGGVWDMNDPRFAEADRDSWGGHWPANFGCPLCS